MGLPSGLNIQFGLAVESSYAGWTTPDTFLPVVGRPTLAADVDRIESAGIIAGRRFRTSTQWVPGNITVGGDVPCEFYDRGFGKVMKAILGGNTTTGSGPYTHTVRPSWPLPSWSVQIVDPANDGTLYPFNYPGFVVSSAEIGLKPGEIATCSLTGTAYDELAGSRSVSDGATTNSSTTVTSSTGAFSAVDIGKVISGTNIPAGATITAINSSTSVTISSAATGTGSSIAITIGAAAASASYASSQYPMSCNNGTFTIGGSTAYLTECTVKIDNSLKTDRRYLGNSRIRQPLPEDLCTVAIDAKAEFESLTDYNNFRNGSEVAYSFALTSPNTSSYSATISGNARLDKANNSGSGRGILEKDLTLNAIASTSNDYSAIQCVLVNGDSSL